MSSRLNRAFTVPLLLAVFLALVLPSPVWAASSSPHSKAGPTLPASHPPRVSTGSRSGKAFTATGKREIDAANAAKHGGVNKCEKCGVKVVPGQKNERGVRPPANQRERDHVIPKSKGGAGTPSNGQVLCRNCNLKKGSKGP